MTLLLGNGTTTLMGKTRPMPIALVSIVFHLSLAILVVWIGTSPAVLVLPDHFRRVMLAPPPPLPPPPPPAAGAAVTRTARIAPSKFVFPAAKILPLLPSAKESMIADAPPEIEAGVSGGVPGGVPGGVVGGVLGGVLGGTLGGLPPPVPVAVVPVPAPKTPVPPPAKQRIEVAGEIQEAKLVSMIQPEYPPLALRARVRGSVHLSAIIDKEGRIVELKLVDGHPLLVDAALAAIKKWRYRPTLQGGEPVEVSTRITVNFRMD